MSITALRFGLITALICCLLALLFGLPAHKPEYVRTSTVSASVITGLADSSTNEDKMIVDAGKGQKLFEGNCSACHAKESKLIGPALKGFYQRWDNDSVLYAFIRNSQDVINSGHPYAVELFHEYNKIVMPPSQLSDADIRNLLAYLGY